MSENELTDTQLTDALNKMIRLDPNVDKLSRAQVVVSHIGLVEERDDYRDTLDQIVKLKWVSYMEDDASIAIEEAQTIARTVREKYKK